MNASEAYKIIGTNWASKYWGGHSPEECLNRQREASAYLAGLKGEEVKILEDALDKLATYQPDFDSWDVGELAKKAVSAFRAAVDDK